MIWPHVNKQHPCPICQKTDWCQFGDRAIKCMRVESKNSCSTGGWYHFYEEDKPEFVPRAELPKPPPSQGFNLLMAEYRNRTQTFQFQALAESLGVLPESLIALGAGYAQNRKAWAFPMWDGLNTILGIRLRNLQGFKWAVPGSRIGVFRPSKSVPAQPICYLPEGPTNTAATLSLGLYAVGRPTCNSGTTQLQETLRNLGIRRVVIIADNDPEKQIGNRQGYPGIEGAKQLQRDLQCKSVIFIPPSPCKDIRDFLKAGGTKSYIESEVNKKVWV